MPSFLHCIAIARPTTPSQTRRIWPFNLSNKAWLVKANCLPTESISNSNGNLKLGITSYGKFFFKGSARAFEPSSFHPQIVLPE